MRTGYCCRSRNRPGLQGESSNLCEEWSENAGHGQVRVILSCDLCVIIIHYTNCIRVSNSGFYGNQRAFASRSGGPGRGDHSPHTHTHVRTPDWSEGGAANLLTERASANQLTARPQYCNRGSLLILGRSPRRVFPDHAFMLHCTLFPHLPAPAGSPSRTAGEGGARWRHLM